MSPTAETGTQASRPRRTVRVPSPSEEKFGERVGLFALAVAGEQGRAVLEGLSAPLAAEATQAFDAAQPLDKAARRARVAQALGPRPEAPKRFERLCRSATVELCAALREAAPQYLRELVPVAREPVPSPQVRSFAARLVREALG